MWAEQRYPEWSEVIRGAREWRRAAAEERGVAPVTIAGGLDFVDFAVRQVSLNTAARSKETIRQLGDPASQDPAGPNDE